MNPAVPVGRVNTLAEQLERNISQERMASVIGVTLALARNPKTPVAVSMNMLARLNDRDLKLLSTDRNVPDVLRATARRRVVSDK